MSGLPLKSFFYEYALQVESTRNLCFLVITLLEAELRACAELFVYTIVVQFYLVLVLLVMLFLTLVLVRAVIWQNKGSEVVELVGRQLFVVDYV